MTDGVGEPIPDNRSLIRESSLAERFCPNSGDSKDTRVCRRAKLTGGSVETKQVRQILWARTPRSIKGLIAECGSLMRNSLLNGKPVERV